MHREPDILQHRIEIAAFQRRIGDPHERIGCQQDEQIECGRDPGLHRQHMRAQRQRQIVAECGDQPAEQREDRHPQQHGAFVIAPDAGDLVDHRLQRMGILEHVEDREVGHDVQRHQRQERRADERQLRQRGRARDIHQRAVVQSRADDRNGGLDQRKAKRQHQRIMPGLGDHCDTPCLLDACAPCALPEACSP